MTSVWDVSERRACRVLKAPRSTHQYKPIRDDQANLKKRIKEIAETRVRYGYRRIHVLLRREGWNVNPKRIYRLYRELGLQLRNKSTRLVWGLWRGLMGSVTLLWQRNAMGGARSDV